MVLLLVVEVVVVVLVVVVVGDELVEVAADDDEDVVEEVVLDVTVEFSELVCDVRPVVDVVEPEVVPPDRVSVDDGIPVSVVLVSRTLELEVEVVEAAPGRPCQKASSA